MGSWKTIMLLLVLCLMTLFTRGVMAKDEVKVTGRPGEKITVPCNTEDQDVVQLDWIKEDKLIVQVINKKTSFPNPEDEDKYTIAISYELIIDQADFSDSGLYTCSFKTDINGTSVNDTKEVKVWDLPNPPVEKPMLEAISSEAMNITWQPGNFTYKSDRLFYIVELLSTAMGDLKSEKVTQPGTTYRVINDLRPYTQYQARVKAVNEVGEGGFSEYSDIVYTHESVPHSPPTITSARTISDSEIRVEFQPPPAYGLNGVLTGFVLMYQISGAADALHSWEVKNSTMRSYHFTKLKPYTTYTVGVRVTNSVGEGPADSKTVKTSEGVPEPPFIYQLTDQTHDAIKVVWSRPKKVNGLLKGYIVSWTWEINGTSEKAHKNITEDLDNDMMYSAITKLIPYKRYQFQVVAFNGKNESSPSQPQTGMTDVKGPSAPWGVNCSGNTTTSILVSWNKPKIIYRRIDQYRIKFRKTDEKFWTLQEMPENQIPKYFSVIEYVITDLETNAIYEVQVAGATASLYSQSPTLVYYSGDYSVPVTYELKGEVEEEVKEDNIFHAGVIAGVALGVLLLIVVISVVTVLRLYRRYYKANKYLVPADHTASEVLLQPSLYLDAYDDSDGSVSVENFAKHVQTSHADGDAGFAQEYEEIHAGVKHDYTTAHSNDPDNKSKNRYINILSYDHSRVELKPVLGRQKHSDYINANYVDGFHKPRAYIATQGPLPHTFADFWRMVWEQNSYVIIMITNLMERGRRKCDQYWPDDAAETYGFLQVKLLNTYVLAHSTMRQFTLRNTKIRKKGPSSERLVYQFHYTDWPDHGVPDFTLPVLDFVKKSQAANPDNAGPVVIHCSAGVGRTGTYIVIESMIRQARQKKSINVKGFLKHIRQQRNYLVQTEEQYVFCHDVLLEWVENGGETECKEAKLHEYLQALTEGGDESLLTKQFKLVTSFSPKDYQVVSANKSYNTKKNRNMNILPVELNRVKLTARPGEEGSDYINATYLEGYNNIKEFIVTQHPMQSTIEDFWRLVWDQNCAIIVLLSKHEGDEFPQFWPDRDSGAMDCGHFHVAFRDEDHQLNHISRDLILESKEDDYELMTRIISSSYWPETCTPLSTTFELVQTVKDWHKRIGNSPIIVVDRDGGSQTGIFCALSTLQDQLNLECAVDIYTIAKLYHLKRPGIWDTQDSYHLLYKALDSIAKDNIDTNGAVTHYNAFGGSFKRRGESMRHRSDTNPHKAKTERHSVNTETAM
ncbi:unnamed protein product [Owenia fusiformis]|uniref:protein-tyrosine-phosphatase n=1 Tax=Owenia fusiformis TaxID=6347 RepID=A0A8J1T588_OWEFU|nr:unnamed protein product [Owenia fusiformis]